MEPRGKLVSFRGRDGLHYLRLVGDNGEVILSSEGHTRAIDVAEVAERYFPDHDLELEHEAGV